MMARSWWWSLVCVLAGCSATPGLGDDPNGNAGSGAGSAGGDLCSFELDKCDHCSGCLARCNCLTSFDPQCPVACGEAGGGGSGGGLPPPPPPPPPPGGGGAGSGGDSGGGGWGGGSTGGSSGAGATGAGGDGGGGGTPQSCVYPSGPYGKTVGQIVSPNLSWQGFRDDGTQGTINIQDYFDCDGTRGVKAVVVIQSATWCGACKEEAKTLNGLIASGWNAKGIKILTLMIENAYGQPATLATAQQWRDAYNATGWSVAADPKFSFSANGSNGLPTALVINPRTMQIVDRKEGYMPKSKAESVAAAN